MTQQSPHQYPHQYLEGDLYQKTELRIERIGLRNVNLNDIAATVAEALGLEHEEVIVIDARDDLLTLDVLRESLDPYLIVGKQDELLQALAALPGIEISSSTHIVSEGMLGWIAVDAEQGILALDRSKTMIDEVRNRIAKRAIVFSTGLEILSRQIEDTNKPTITQRLEREGYKVRAGENLDDDRDTIVAHLNDAVYSGGYGLVITTGGVGAEAKDHSVEALLEVDPGAATPYIARFEKGLGRHVKDGIRIGVGRVDDTLLVALPGPNDEVIIAMEVLLQGLKDGLAKEPLAKSIAAVLRDKLRQNHQHWKHHH
jgi:molybdenum cofactor synthesis domain-containing protein